jgi:hypothetical protein
MGVINPALKTDWALADKAIKQQPRRLFEVIQKVNQSGNDVEKLMENLRRFDQETLLFLAMEVAREYVDFEDRKTLH